MRRAFSFCRLPPGSLNISFSTSPVLYRARAPYDTVTRTITLTVWIGLMALLAFIIHLMVIYEVPMETFTTVTSLMFVVILGILIGAYLFSPKEYELTLDGLIVRRVIRSFKIPYRNITEVKRIRWTWKGIRWCASGGIYGFYGLFWKSGIGNVWMYVKDRSKMILIRTADKTQYAISPENPDEFLRKLEEILKRERNRKF